MANEPTTADLAIKARIDKLRNIQKIIELTVVNLVSLRTQCVRADTRVQLEVKKLEEKLERYFSTQVKIYHGADGTDLSSVILDEYPQTSTWLRVLDMEKEYEKFLMHSITLNLLARMDDKEIEFVTKNTLSLDSKCSCKVVESVRRICCPESILMDEVPTHTPSFSINRASSTSPRHVHANLHSNAELHICEPLRKGTKKEHANLSNQPRRISHSIEHRFVTKQIILPTMCKVCRKMMVRGRKCKHCNYVCHFACETHASSTCGLPEGLEDFAKMLINVESPEHVPPSSRVWNNVEIAVAQSSRPEALKMTRSVPGLYTQHDPLLLTSELLSAKETSPNPNIVNEQQTSQQRHMTTPAYDGHYKGSGNRRTPLAACLSGVIENGIQLDADQSQSQLSQSIIPLAPSGTKSFTRVRSVGNHSSSSSYNINVGSVENLNGATYIRGNRSEKAAGVIRTNTNEGELSQHPVPPMKNHMPRPHSTSALPAQPYTRKDHYTRPSPSINHRSNGMHSSTCSPRSSPRSSPRLLRPDSPIMDTSRDPTLPMGARRGRRRLCSESTSTAYSPPTPYLFEATKGGGSLSVGRRVSAEGGASPHMQREMTPSGRSLSRPRFTAMPRAMSVQNVPGFHSPSKPDGFFGARDRNQMADWEIPWEDLSFVKRISDEGKGIGEVHLGKYHGDVAIKVWNIDNCSEELLLSFKREVAILRKLRHQNVLLFMGACIAPPNLAIVTKFCHGPTLYYRIHKEEIPLSLTLMIECITQIAQGMEYLHARHVLARKLTSKNVFIESDGQVYIGGFSEFTILHLTQSHPGLSESTSGFSQANIPMDGRRPSLPSSPRAIHHNLYGNTPSSPALGNTPVATRAFKRANIPPPFPLPHPLRSNLQNRTTDQSSLSSASESSKGPTSETMLPKSPTSAFDFQNLRQSRSQGPLTPTTPPVNSDQDRTPVASPRSQWIRKTLPPKLGAYIQPEYYALPMNIHDLQYFPHEIMENNHLGAFTPASDIYAYGIIVYEILAGGYPYPDLLPEQIIRQVTSGVKPDLSRLDSDAPPALIEMMKQCL
eukprot:Ihof_evm6s76 gene=Ihof_evmTU6s76